MVADISKYVGREQAFVKHFFLESYLESLVHKTASIYSDIAYVDGFSGPWQSTGEKFEDTSFGIALAALRKAKQTWKAQGKEVRMSAHLVEQSVTAYAALKTIKPKFPDVEIHTYNGDFVALSPTILQAVRPEAFAFIFIDPKGWTIDIQRLASLLERQNSEVVFNFMFDFINRAASIDEPKIVASLTKLMPVGSWKENLKTLRADSNSDDRKKVLVEAFRGTLKGIGGYKYVAHIPVLQRIMDRTLYSLFYGTRHDKGIEVFRSCHVKTELEQAKVRTATKHAHQEEKTRQTSLFGAEVALAPDDTARFLEDEKTAARDYLLSLIPSEPQTTTYRLVWPQVLERYVVTKPNVNHIASTLRKEGRLIFPGWAARKQVPDDNYRVSRKA